MTENKNVFLLFACFATFLFFRILYSWYSDYKFYAERNWDYSQSSGRELRYGAAMLRLGKMSNQDKMTFGYRKGAAVFFTLMVVSWLPLIFE